MSNTTLQRPLVEDGVWHFFGGDLTTWMVREDKEAGLFTSGQRFKAGGSPHTGSGRKSTATPPYHYHLYQTETFHVQEGTLSYLIDGVEGKLQEGEKVSIPPYRPHTFWNDETTGKDLVVNITVQGGPNPGFDETFVHNFYGYLSSRVMAGGSPNPVQMLRFLDDADVIIADFPLGLGHWANIILGRFVGGTLGFPTRFDIFADRE
ncbi:unnamed protein product [Parajaminaea phylloscopi]